MSKESFSQQLDRLEMMAEGNDKWDLSPNDTAAIFAVLQSHSRLLSALKDFTQNPAFDVAIGGNPNAVGALIANAQVAIAKAEVSR